jgi:hypothetical protein
MFHTNIRLFVVTCFEGVTGKDLFTLEGASMFLLKVDNCFCNHIKNESTLFQ